MALDGNKDQAPKIDQLPKNDGGQLDQAVVQRTPAQTMPAPTGDNSTLVPKKKWYENLMCCGDRATTNQAPVPSKPKASNNKKADASDTDRNADAQNSDDNKQTAGVDNKQAGVQALPVRTA